MRQSPGKGSTGFSWIDIKYYPDTDTTREDVEVALPRRFRGESNFNYRVGAVE